jgi:hypothetical protein
MLSLLTKHKFYDKLVGIIIKHKPLLHVQAHQDVDSSIIGSNDEA